MRVVNLDEGMDKYAVLKEVDEKLVEAQVALLNVGKDIRPLAELRDEIRLDMKKLAGGL